MSDYPTGSVKYDPATLDSEGRPRSIAVRTEFPEVGALVNHAWLVATTGSGAVNKTSADVESWTDLPLPAAPAAVIDAEVIPEQPAVTAPSA